MYVGQIIISHYHKKNNLQFITKISENKPHHVGLQPNSSTCTDGQHSPTVSAKIIF